MKTYHNIEQVKADIHNGVLDVDDDIEIAFDGFDIEADIKCENIYSKEYLRNINAGNIKAGNINAGNIHCLDINAGNIYCIDIKAVDINAGDINAGNINARNINAMDINARDINARDINAENINYYALCFAYDNIICCSIVGQRINSKHFCLDGKIKIKEKIEEMTLEEVCRLIGREIKIKK